MSLSSALFSTEAFGQAVSLKNFNHPGIKWGWPIKAEQYVFTVNTTSNYDMQNVTFNKDAKTLTFLGNSSHTGNIAEIEIPTNLIGGNYTVYQDGNQVSPIILKNANLTTVILKFNDTGNVKTDVIGTTYLPEFADIAPIVMVVSFGILFLTTKYRKI
ncbi:MAG: hypothetical protein KGH89_08615 [Thaumarchaeota archaeon]|nr:hypothetical protein [Nitrososphaerota archaeon]MDE1867124.1 hypothetical protein [Nitrososphaerota archaeon]